MLKRKRPPQIKEADEAPQEKQKPKKTRRSCNWCFGSKAEDSDEDYGPSDTNTVEKKNDVLVTQDSRATADRPTTGKHSVPKETAALPAQTSSKRDSLYDNIPRSEKTEVAEIHEGRTPESKEVKSENVQNQKESEKKNFLKSKAAEIHEAPIPERNEVKSENNLPNQKEIEKKNYVNSKASIVLKEPSDEYDRKKCEIVVFDREPKLSNMKRMVAEIHEARTPESIEVKSENVQNRKEIERKIFVKSKAAEIHEAPKPESNEVKSDKNVPNQKEIEKKNYVNSKASIVLKEPSDEYDRKKCEIVAFDREPKLSNMKRMAIGLGNYQATTHVPDSTTSAAQQLCEVDSASSTIRHRAENNAEVKARHVDPPIQEMHVLTQIHQLPLTSQHFGQQSFKQESVTSQKTKMSYIQPENTLSIHLSKFQEDSSERPQESFTSETESVSDQEEKQVPPSTASDAQTPHEMVSAAKAVEKENEITKRNKSKEDTPKEVTTTRRPEARRPVGLQNLGNTCFFNAVMQNLNQSFLLYEVLAQEGCPLSLTESMVRFYKKMCSGTSYTVNPREVLGDICRRSPRFAGGRQQDSHELLRHLLDGLRTEERESLGNPNNRKILTNVDKVFGGHFMTVYTCKDCRTPYHVCEPLLDISLPIAYEDFQTDEESSVNEEDGEVSQADTSGDGVMYQKVAESMMTPLAIKQKKEAQDNCNEYGPDVEVHQPSKRNKNKRKNKDKPKVKNSTTEKRRRKERSILDCLTAFTRTEHIADEYLCMACHAKRVNQGATDYQMTSAKKRTLIYNPPALLTLHLKRFEQTPRGFVKCNDSISFQDMIDIGPYCSSWCMRNERKQTSIWYSLYGLVVHGGSLDGGHYVAYVKLRERDDHIRQFLQESYLDRDQLTVEKLVEMMKEMHELPKQPEKSQPKPVSGTWFYISDSHFSEASEDQVWRQQAYLLFYERRQGSTKSKCYQRTAMTTSV